MGYIIDTIRKSVFITKNALTEDSEPHICEDVDPEYEFEDMLKVIERDSIDVVEDNDEKD